MLPCIPASSPEGQPLRPTRAERRRRDRGAAKRRPTPEELQEVVRDQGVLAMMCGVGLATLSDMLEEDATRHCGVKKKGKHTPGRTGYRNGHEQGVVVIGGQQVPMSRPRVVGMEGGEVVLPTYQAARDAEFLSNAVLMACLKGVSQRKHRLVTEALAPLGPEAGDLIGLSKSAVGRRFIATADGKVRAFLRRPLDQPYLAVWIDAVYEGDYAMLCAVGLTDDGKKQVLGLRAGTVEDKVLSREFFDDLRQRGFSADDGVLFVIDGGKAMAPALREVFGAHVAIQRCQIHKKRNILEKLPEAERDAAGLQYARALAEPDAGMALAKLELLAARLEDCGYAAAAASVREGKEEMVTCIRLGVPSDLWPSLTNTNIIESCFSQHETVTRRVKRWRNGQQAVRWAGISLLEAEKSFTTVGTPSQRQALRDALRRHTAESAVQLSLWG